MPDEPQVEQEKTLLTWKGKSRPYDPNQEKTRSTVVVLGILITVVLMFAGEWMMIVLMAAGAFYYYAQNRMPPEMVVYELTNKGLKAFGRTYLWWEFKRWWAETRGVDRLIILEMTSGLMGRMYLPLGNAKEEEIEKILSRYILKEQPEETAADRLTKWVGEKFPLADKI